MDTPGCGLGGHGADEAAADLRGDLGWNNHPIQNLA